ncbi:MAG: hypothetical protein KDA21_01470 [Phycisphaerales bacterium]|nr:hypothetical protein [Phycisphaerales bacterium]
MTPNDGAQRRGPGPKPDRLRIDGDWEDAIADAMKKPKPPGGWPRGEDQDGEGDDDADPKSDDRREG